MNSFIHWVGGKKALRDVLIARFPPNYERYIEVFGGGGWILFHKKPDDFEVYNDFNSDLTNMFHVVKDSTLEFLAELGQYPFVGRDEFRVLTHFLKQKHFDRSYMKREMELAQTHLKELEYAEYVEIMTTKAELFDVMRAVTFFKLIRYSYAGGCTSVSCQPTDIRKTFRLVEQASKRLNDKNGVFIENKDFESLIRQYDREASFFYCDPPYYEAESCYAMVFSKDDHVRLRDTLKSIEGKFLLSYNDCEYIRELYKDFYMESVVRLNNISQRYSPGGQYEELIIANYDLSAKKKAQPHQLSLGNFGGEDDETSVF